MGSAVFFLLAPGTVAGLVPWLITGWRTAGHGSLVARGAGAALAAAGLVVVLIAFGQFVTEGHGTPAPVAPTDQLVVGGLYRFVRNPMYVAVAAVIGGQAIFFASWGLLVWLLVFGVAVWSFVTGYEQPTLLRRYGDAYAEYCAAVPGWWPRRSPYRGRSVATQPADGRDESRPR